MSFLPSTLSILLSTLSVLLSTLSVLPSTLSTLLSTLSILPSTLSTLLSTLSVLPSTRHYRAPIPRYSHVGIQNISLFRSFLSFLHKEMIRIENLNFFDFMFRGYFWIPAFAGMTEGMLGMTE